MSIHTELCQFQTADGETLHGLLFTPSAPAAPPDLAFVLAHGVALNFYTGPLPTGGQLLAEQGHAVLCMNTRGHDWVARAGNGSAFGGAAYEEIEGCLPDLDAALAWLGERGYARYVLFGHSLGAVKALYYQGTRQRPNVVGVVACSAPKQFYSARAEEMPAFLGHLADAQARLGAGRGDELLWAPTGGALGLFTARTFVNKYGPDERTDVRTHAARLQAPLLAIAGSEEVGFAAYADELVAAAGPARGTAYVVAGADHFYGGYEPELVRTVVGWLA